MLDEAGEIRADGGYELNARAFNTQLESVRGIAALMVAMFHIGQSKASGYGMLAFGADQGSPFWQAMAAAYAFIANGEAAVVLFFVLSGHVLMQSLEKANGSQAQVSFVFVVRRLLRLLPPVAFMILCFLAVFYASGLGLPGVNWDHFAPISIMRHMLLLQASINGVAWTLQVEMLGILVVLFAWLASRRFGPAAIWAVAILLFVAGLDKASSGFIPSVIDPELRYFRFMFAFPAGMLIGPSLRIFEVTRMPAAVRATYPFLGCALILSSAYISERGTPLCTLAEVFGSCFLIASLVLGFNRRLGRLLDNPVLRFYGRISYSFYLLHPLSIVLFWNTPEWLAGFIQAGIPGVVIAFGLFLLSVAMVTPLAVLSHRHVEIPSIRLGRRIGDRVRSAPVPQRPDQSGSRA